MKSVPSISVPKTAAEPLAGGGKVGSCISHREGLLSRLRLHAAVVSIRFANFPLKLAFRLARLGMLDRSTFRLLMRVGRTFRQLSWDLWQRSSSRAPRGTPKRDQ